MSRPGHAAFRSALWGVMAALVVAPPLPAQQTAWSPADRQTAWPLPRLAGPIRVDGRSDDPAWQSVAPLPMTVHLPRCRGAPTERTVVRIAYDDEALYVIVESWEAHPGSVRASSMIRDDAAPGDFLNVMLDTFDDGQNAVAFSTTPGGQRHDWTISNDAQTSDALSAAWNGVWELATRRELDGWHAEFRIPFSTLRFSTRDGRVEFGLSINRLTAHAGERVTFPAIEPSAAMALWKPSRWQRVSVELQLDRLDFGARGEREWSRLGRLRVLTSANPRLSLSAVIQANGLADVATANLRLRYNVREGHDLWVVYGHHANLDRDRIQPAAPGTARVGMVVKYTRSFGN